MKQVENLALVQGDNGNIGFEELAEYFKLIGKAHCFPECIHNFQTGIFSGICYDECEYEDGEIVRFYYAIGIVSDGDEGATVYIVRPNSSMKTRQLANYLFDDVRADDMQTLSSLFGDLWDLVDDIETLEREEYYNETV